LICSYMIQKLLKIKVVIFSNKTDFPHSTHTLIFHFDSFQTYLHYLNFMPSIILNVRFFGYLKNLKIAEPVVHFSHLSCLIIFLSLCYFLQQGIHIPISQAVLLISNQSKVILVVAFSSNYLSTDSIISKSSLYNSFFKPFKFFLF
jgi:hypothetical protein